MKREKVEEKRRERSNNIEEVISLVQYQVNWNIPGATYNSYLC